MHNVKLYEEGNVPTIYVCCIHGKCITKPIKLFNIINLYEINHYYETIVLKLADIIPNDFILISG